MADTTSRRVPKLQDLIDVIDADAIAPRYPSQADERAYVDLLRAAAVSSFFEIEEVKARLFRPSPKILAQFRRDCLVTVRGGRRVWRLRDDRRRTVFKRFLPNAGELRNALPMRLGPEDVLARTLRSYVEDGGKPLREQTSEELASSDQVVRWLDGIVVPLPTPSSIGAMIGRFELLRPLRQLAGEEAHFTGRRKELARLREFVGVLEPNTSLDAWLRRFRNLVGLRPTGPMPLTGVGGAGKSTLLAKFLLDHIRLDGPQQIPFTYLDFDRASISPDDTAALLLEMVKQLAAQFLEHGKSLERLWRDLHESLRTSRSDATEEAGKSSLRFDDHATDDDSFEPQVGGMIDALAEALRRIDLGDKPYLVIFDTFEEAQYKAEAGLHALWSFVLRLRTAIPHLRLVVCGRAMPSRHLLPPEIRFERGVVLDDLEVTAALAYMRARGLDPSQARAVVDQVGRFPLALRLAAEILATENVTDLGRFRGRSLLGFPRSTDWIIAQLYNRILSHIHDDDTRKLAHPGLVVRCITPDVLRWVVAPVCGVDIPNDARAKELFDELRREVGLVVDEGSSLRHRPDVRSRMLQLMKEERPQEVQELHARAVTHWARRTLDTDEISAIQARAEEIYHRLSLQHDYEIIRDRWVPGVQRYLRRSVDELPARSAEILRGLIGEDDQELPGEGASSAERSASVLRKAKAFLHRGRPDEALGLLDEENVDADVRAKLEAQALDQMLRWPDALTILDAAAARDPEDLELSVERADIAFRLGNIEYALHLTSTVNDSPRDSRSEKEAVLRLESDLIRLACMRLVRRSDEVEKLALRSRDRVEALPTSRLKRVPHTVRRYALLVGDHDPNAVASFLRIAGPIAYSSAELAVLAQSLAIFDERVSTGIGQPAGVVARRVGLDAETTNNTLLWTRFVASVKPEWLFDVVMAVLEREPLTRADATEFANLVRFRQPEWRPQVAWALRTAFDSTSDLRSFSRDVLHIHEATMPKRDGLWDLSKNLARRADSEGLLLHLAKRLYATYPSLETERVAEGLTRWSEASAWTETTTMSHAVPRRTDVPTVPLLELVTRFYELSLPDRIALAESMELTNISERDLDATGLSRLILARAKEKGQLAVLAERLGIVPNNQLDSRP